MKKIFLLLTGIAYFTSCKKIYTCECSTTYIYYTEKQFVETETMAGGNTAYSEKMKKKQAEAACLHEQNATQTNFINGVTSNGSTPLKKGESVSTTCELK